MPHMLSLSASLYAVADEVFVKRGTAVEQGGLLSGTDPTKVNTADPIRLWIIQLAIIMCTCQLLSFVLRWLKQPKVIAEVIGGIVLGPTLMGRIPGFTQHIFPKDSLPFLSLVANIGLVLFLFLVGLEIETTSIKRNARTSLLISMGGMILPFSIGAGMSKLIYANYVETVTPDTAFTHFMLFTCVAYSITAFPVLCRILTELKLLDTTVGICALSAGVGNDIVGWTLLALSVALVNATSGLSALYIVLVAVGWALVVVFPVRKAFFYIAVKTDSIAHSEPSLVFMTITLIFVFASAFFTDVIGVHAIFGGFLAGLVVPRENGLAIKMTEKIEDLVGIVFLPLYFTLSGLSTNLGLLNTGRIWGHTMAIIITAWIGKFFGASSGAKIAGFGWREAGAIGELMSCKGLVELIVLNVGLQAGILSTLVFSMFVLEALALTFFTTPGLVLLYPPHLRRRIAKHPIGTSRTLEGDAPEPEKKYSRPGGTRESILPYGSTNEKSRQGRWSNITVILDRIEHLPGLICASELLRRTDNDAALVEESDAPSSVDTKAAGDGNGLALVNVLPANTQLDGELTRSNSSTTPVKIRDGLPLPPLSRMTTSNGATRRQKGIVLNAIRLMELSDRTSAVMKSILDSSSLLVADPLVNIFKTIEELRGGLVRNVMKIEVAEEWANAVEETVSEIREKNDGGELVVACWLGAAPAVSVPLSSATIPEEGEGAENVQSSSTVPNPFEFFFSKSNPTSGLNPSKSTTSLTQQALPYSKESAQHAQFIRSLFAKSTADVALYVDNSSSADVSLSLHPATSGLGGHKTIFFPFFGGPDDRAALEMVVDMCRNGGIRGVVVRMTKGERATSEEGGEGVERPEAAYVPGNTIASSIGYTGTIPGAGNTVSAFPDTIYAPNSSATRLQSRTADEISWEKYNSPSSASYGPTGIEFTNMRSPSPLEALTTVAHTIRSQSASTGRMLVVVGRSRRLAVEGHHAELSKLIREAGHGRHLGSDFRKTIGDVASALVIGGLRTDMLVLQAAYGSPSIAEV